MAVSKGDVVTDESMRPVAVLINYQDWQAIEKILETYQQQIRDKVRGEEKFDASD
ncbi:MAG: hypothetical protein HC769_22985 [Cyanobacteria bacterium CRU_2_1]|nr:hypothetical protein [Cyanobacteria bacterium RU_5_0]NJR61443.1 hypothetical protein [Cyanobacteria bacterium CRU_2_1]